MLNFKEGDWIIHKSEPDRHIAGPILNVYVSDYVIDNRKQGVGIDIRHIHHAAIDKNFTLDEQSIVTKILTKYEGTVSVHAKP